MICDLDKRLLIISQPSVTFDSHESRKNEFITFYVCYLFLTLCDRVINRLCDFVNNKPASEPTTLSSLVAIGLAEVEM